MNRSRALIPGVVLTLAVGTPAGAALVSLLDTSGSLGAALDGVEVAGGTYAVPEIPGLNLTLVSLTGQGSGSYLNATSASFGINSGDSGDDTARFDHDYGESMVLRFDREVTIFGLDFESFTQGEGFSFDGVAIGLSDLDSSKEYRFPGGRTIAPNTNLTLAATSGSIGLISIEMSAVPEPAGALVGTLLGAALFRRRRRDA